MKRRRRCGFAILLAAASGACAFAAPPALPLLVSDDFERGMDRWRTTDPNPAKSVWRTVELEAGPAGGKAMVLRVDGPSSYKPPFRSPLSIALLKDVKVGDFELTVDVQSTNPTAGGHRDMCLFWGYQDPAHFYYVHLGAKADPHACQIFIVNKADRTAITLRETKGTPWTDGWHKLKLVRRVRSGDVEVYFDDMDNPLMTAHDNTFKQGGVGLGTFDDNGHWDNFKLFAVAAKPSAAGDEPDDAKTSP